MKTNHWNSIGPIVGLPGRRRFSTPTGPSMNFCCISGDSISFGSGQ